MENSKPLASSLNHPVRPNPNCFLPKLPSENFKFQYTGLQPTYQIPCFQFGTTKPEQLNNAIPQLSTLQLSPDQSLRRKRRSKVQYEGKEYPCGCGKLYMSYPALYTHVKTKHNGVNPSGSLQSLSGRGRGRPQKLRTCSGNASMTNCGNHLGDNVLPGQYKQEIMEETKENNAQCRESILKKYGVLQDNNNVAYILFEDFLKLTKQNQLTYYSNILEQVKTIGKEEERSCYKKEKDVLEKESKAVVPKNCERILAEYLCEMVKKVNEKFFMTLILFTRLYRDYMKYNGWDIADTADSPKKAESTIMNDSEKLTGACNNFVSKFLPIEYPNFDYKIAFDLTSHLCQWLSIKGYTLQRAPMKN